MCVCVYIICTSDIMIYVKKHTKSIQHIFQLLHYVYSKILAFKLAFLSTEYNSDDCSS